MRTMLILVLAVAVVTAACGPREASDAPYAGMNLLLISLDTTRADHFECISGRTGLTREMDKFAARSSLFRNATSETNVTNPSHLTMMTGLRAIQHGVHNNRRQIPVEQDLMSWSAKRAGYRTAGFVATPHLGHDMGWSGFDEFPDPKSVLDGIVVTDSALKWLDTNDGSKPFFLWTHYFDAHTPYRPPEKLAQGLFRKKELTPSELYAAEVFHMDRQVGRLLDGLAERGFAENTIIVVVGDHGESLGEHGIFYSHSGMYEQQLRIPLIVHVPGQEPRVHDAPVSTLDVAPTITELMGLTYEHEVAGQSLAGLMRGDSEGSWEDRTMIHQSAHNKAVVARIRDWKLIWPLRKSKDGSLPDQPVLFDLSSDPEELVDLAAEHSDRVAEMKELIDPWISQGFVPPKEDPPHLDKEALERLEALGYIN